MTKRTKGFTLIELLVVIAIIGILAVMVFPVFARARESARKAVCLSNVKNIALAFQMYLADNNDTMPPTETRSDVINYFEVKGGDDYGDWCVFQSNPYLRYPVIMDEYIKNRDVWRCPSAKMESGASWIVPGPDWFGYMVTYDSEWGPGASDADGWVAGPCFWSWPPGWGGDVTDSYLQGRLAVGELGENANEKGFIQTIGTVWAGGLKLVEVDDPVHQLVCFDAGAQTEDTNTGLLAYPDLCALGCGNEVCGWSGGPDCWDVTSDDSCCGDMAYSYAPWNGAFLRHPELRKPYARHLGGTNIGFMDGHAAWWPAEKIIAAVRDGDLTGTGDWYPTTACYPTWNDDYPGVPVLY